MTDWILILGAIAIMSGTLVGMVLGAVAWYRKPFRPRRRKTDMEGGDDDEAVHED